MTTALFIGKFQPFHLGHLGAIKQILAENEKVVIAISETSEPFTTSERKEMIELALAEAEIENYKIISIQAPYVKFAKTQVKFDSVCTSDDPKTRHCFSEAGFQVKQIKRISPYSSTLVRERIKNSAPWEELVPDAVHTYLLKINAQQRIK
ncbi:MAG: adenylyltransferase/cytidyltransferase family protein [archaeon]